MKPEQITAWALDEASAEERLQLEAELRDDPTTQKSAEDTRAFCSFLLAELRDDSLALTDQQRERLKAAAAAPSPASAPKDDDAAMPQSWSAARREERKLKPSRWTTGIMVRLAAAACLTLACVWGWQEHGARLVKRDALAARVVGEKEATAYQVRPGSAGHGASATMAMPAPASGFAAVPGHLAGVPGLLGAPLPASPMPSAFPGVLVGNTTMTTGDVEELKRMQDQVAYGVRLDPAKVLQVNVGSAAAGGGTGVGNGITLQGARGIADASSVASAGSGTTTLSVGGVPVDPAALMTLPSGPPVAMLGDGDRLTTSSGTISGLASVADGTAPQLGKGVHKGLLIAGSSVELGKYDTAIAQYQDVLRKDPYNGAARRGMENAEQKHEASFRATFDHQRAKMVAQVDEAWEQKVPVGTTTGTLAANSVNLASVPPALNPSPKGPDTRYFESEGIAPSAARLREEAFRPQLESPSSAESYQRIIENELKDVAREPLSTFSIDVDTAAYANVRRFLNQGMIPPADAVRIEELINYFPAAEEGPTPGAKEPFAVRVEMAPCPWQPEHRLARIAIKGRELGAERKASNLVFLVDVSGSMGEPNKLPLVQQSLRMLAEQLGEGDRVTMVVYAGSSGLVLPPTNGQDKQAILAAIDRLQAGGGTHGSAGIQLAYEQAVAGFIKDGVNRVILCTDGDFNVGVSSPEELEKLITHKAKSGVFLSVLGFGGGNLKDRTMETLADKGNGNYAYIDSLSEARKVLVEQMSGTLVTIAKDVKIQVEFNPAAVRSYRLVGYENRLLAKEDFNDDTKDAGEIGAGHSVVALYEVVPASLPPGAEPRPLVDNLRYQTAAASAVPPSRLAEAAKSGEVMTVKLRYKEPESSLSKLVEVPAKDEGKTLTASTEEFKFSAAVAGFGLLLRDSAYKGTLGWETVRKLALDGKGGDKMGHRGEFLQLIDKARGLKETRP